MTRITSNQTRYVDSKSVRSEMNPDRNFRTKNFIVDVCFAVAKAIAGCCDSLVLSPLGFIYTRANTACTCSFGTIFQ